MIQITKALLSEKFNEFNREFFNGEVKKTDFVISHNRSRYGQFRPRTWAIEISTAWVRSERDYWNTLIHEMAHAYVRQKYGRYVQPHGCEWKSVANRINAQMNGKYGTIQRVGGGQDKTILRVCKSSMFVAFEDCYGKWAIARISNITYIDKLKALGGMKDDTEYIVFVSDEEDLCRIPCRKVHARGVWWNHMSKYSKDKIEHLDTIVQRSVYHSAKLRGVA